MTEENQVSTFRKYFAICLLVLIIVISVGGSVLLVQHWEYVRMIESQGLLGLFLLSIFAGSPIPIPTPSMILTFTMGSIFNPLIVAAVSGSGNALGNVFVYLTGRGGLAFFRSFSQPKPKPAVNGENTGSEKPAKGWNRIWNKLWFPRMRELIKKHAGWAVIVLSIYPNPVLTPLIISMGAARYNFWNFLLFIWAGKTLQGLALSYLGYFGLRSILHFFGIKGI